MVLYEYAFKVALHTRTPPTEAGGAFGFKWLLG